MRSILRRIGQSTPPVRKCRGPNIDMKIDTTKESRRPISRATAPIRNTQAKLGRNDPCWCGSGKKFKKCHLGKDGESGRTGMIEDGHAMIRRMRAQSIACQFLLRAWSRGRWRRPRR